MIDGEGWSKTCTDPAGIQRNKLRSTRIVDAEMLKRKTYGEKPLPGSDPNNPLHIKVDREEALAKLVGNRADPAPAKPSE